VDYLGSRNHIWFVWRNVPAPYLLPHLAATTLNVLLHALSPARLWRRATAVGAAYLAILGGRVRRAPVSRKAYRSFRFLGRHPGALIGATGGMDRD
jgi:hypothetical protein